MYGRAGVSIPGMCANFGGMFNGTLSGAQPLLTMDSGNHTYPSWILPHGQTFGVFVVY